MLLHSCNFFFVFLMFFLISFGGVGGQALFCWKLLALYICPLPCLCKCCVTCNSVICYSFIFHFSSLAFFSQVARCIFDELFTASLPGCWVSFISGGNIRVMVCFDVLRGVRLVCI